MVSDPKRKNRPIYAGWWPGLDSKKVNLRIRFWSVVFTSAVTGWVILKEEYGDNHVFSEIQKAYRRRMNDFFRVEGGDTRR
mmetsp:Transcript_44482/g.108660  ORF Transcript_44482/g.108660 Transcript_44482/m.108660 type:complete len:81 (+) Transcript_44482:109-351(+)